MKCKYYDCGWCYAPPEVKSNDRGGKCLSPLYCEERDRQWGIIEATTNSRACFCIGPQNGEELCPCMKKDKDNDLSKLSDRDATDFSKR